MASSNLSIPTANKPPRILACVLCQHRKIKCDRNFPCQTCLKANVKCVPSTPAPARKRRRPNQDLQERLARCEDLLKEYAAEKPEDENSPSTETTTTSTASTQNFPTMYDDPFMKWNPGGKLIKEEGGVRFLDNPLLMTMMDELRAMREIVDEEDIDETTPDTSPPDDNSDLLLAVDTPATGVEELWPEPVHVFRLWQTYLDRVNPLTKIIHVPTLQPTVVEASVSPQNLSKNTEALLFSIFLMATVSLSPDETKAMLGYPREEALQRFSTGVKLSLARLNFLKYHDLTTLQALVIYLVSLQGRYNRHGAWILNGVVIRIAQKMGLHRDGEILGLPPFETEMRRRIWGQIISVDVKYAMLSGLSQSLLPRSWDTREPRNLNDADLFPSATEPFQDRDGPTEMIFCLLTYKISQFLVQSPGLDHMVIMHELDTLKGQPNSPPEATVEQIRRSLEVLASTLLNFLDKYCDPTAGPIHEMAHIMKGHIMEKLGELIAPPPLKPKVNPEMRTPKDNAFRIAVLALEHNSKNYISMKEKVFLWFSLLHFQSEVFVYLAGQLYHRVEGDLVERAWHQVGIVYEYHPELLDMSNKTYQTCAVFILKAWKRREEVLAARNGSAPQTPSYIERIRKALPNYEPQGEPTPPDPALLRTPSELNSAGTAQTDGTDTSMDQYMGGYLEASIFDWDMFGNTGAVAGSFPTGLQGPLPNSHQQPFAGFGMGPSAEW